MKRNSITLILTVCFLLTILIGCKEGELTEIENTGALAENTEIHEPGDTEPAITALPASTAEYSPSLSAVIDVSAESALPVVGSETPAIEQQTIEPTVDVDAPYYLAYFDIIESMIEKYGFYIDNDEVGRIFGLSRVELMDFDGDGAFELFCLYRKQNDNWPSLAVYQFSDGKTNKLLDTLSRNGIFDDIIYGVLFGDINGKRFILIEDSDWGRIERIYVYTIENGELHKKSFYADVDAEDVAPPIYELVNLKIDGVPVDIDEYTAEKERYYSNTNQYWDENWTETGILREETSQKIREIARMAHVDSAEVDKLLS